MRVILLLWIFLFCIPYAQAEICFWVDEKGVRHFSNAGSPTNQVERTWKEIERAVTDEVSEPNKKPLETEGVKEATVATTVAPAPEKEAAPKVIYVPVKQETEYEKNVRRYKEWKKRKAEEIAAEKQRKHEEKIAALELRRAKMEAEAAKSKAKAARYKRDKMLRRASGVKIGDGSFQNKRVTHEEQKWEYERRQKEYEKKRKEVEEYNAWVREQNARNAQLREEYEKQLSRKTYRSRKPYLGDDDPNKPYYRRHPAERGWGR